MRKLLVGCVAVGAAGVIIFALVLIGGSAVSTAPSGKGGPAAPGFGQSTYTIEVSGDAGQSFMGSYMVTTLDGSNTGRSVEGTVPASYEAQGAAISAVAQKRSEGGQLLRVRILKGDQVVGESETTAAYGGVTVAGR